MAENFSTKPTAEFLNQHLGQRLKQLRQGRGWSLDALARLSGVSRSMISEIERERANPTLAVTVRLARAFDMGLGEFVELPADGQRIRVIRAGDEAQVFSDDSQCRIRTLSPLGLEKDVEFYELRLRPGGGLTSEPHFSGTREFLVVQRGEVEVRSGDSLQRLAMGDSATYPADVPHAISNAGDSEALVFLVATYR